MPTYRVVVYADQYTTIIARNPKEAARKAARRIVTGCSVLEADKPEGSRIFYDLHVDSRALVSVRELPPDP